MREMTQKAEVLTDVVMDERMEGRWDARRPSLQGHNSTMTKICLLLILTMTRELVV